MMCNEIQVQMSVHKDFTIPYLDVEELSISAREIYVIYFFFDI